MTSSSRLKRTHVLLPEDLLDDVDALVGARRRSSFIADAVMSEVRRRRLKAAVAEMDGALADVDIPGWETPEAAAAWVRALRDGEELPQRSDTAA